MHSIVLSRHQGLAAYLGAGAVSLGAGVLVARSQEGVSLVLLGVISLAGLAVLLSLSPGALFLGWLVVAPIFADAARVSPVGRVGIWALYTAPALLLGTLAIARARTGAIVSFAEWLPAAFVGYVLVSIVVTSDSLQSNPLGTVRFVVLTVALGPALYYFLTIGPGSAISREKIVVVLIAGAALQGVFALVEAATHRNLWGFTAWQRSVGGARSVATLANPGILGTFLGVGIVLALAALTWGGPRSLRRLSLVTLVVAVPGLLVTLTRGPILATAVAAVSLLLLGRQRVLSLLAIGAVVVALVALWPNIRGTATYQQRASETTTVRVRSGLQDWSLQLAAKKPLFGWGYGSFDRVKNSADLTSVGGIPVVYLLDNTSHNSYLTVLVELGAVGLLLYALPFLILTARAVSRARAPTPDRWIAAGATASLAVILLSATTLDFRFFSFAQALPWILLAILRNGITPPLPPPRQT